MYRCVVMRLLRLIVGVERLSGWGRLKNRLVIVMLGILSCLRLWVIVSGMLVLII